MSRRLVLTLAAGILIPAAAACTQHESPRARRLIARTEAVAASTSRENLAATATASRQRLSQNTSDAQAAITLSATLLRQTRVSGNAGLAIEAERVLNTALRGDPDNYLVRRALAEVYLSQHRFRDALEQTARCLSARRDDAVVHGIAGDSHLELGEYAEAFAAFDRMNAAKPTASSYARASYARELQGDLPGALSFMEMAAEATPPSDTESLAWHHAQLGHLYLELGRLVEADREYAHADYVFPGHPFASDGHARVAAAQGDYPRALAIVTTRLASAPLPADFALAGDLLMALGKTDEAERQYRLGEAAWRSDAPDPGRLARFLAERGRRLDDATRLAELAYADRPDIFTADALAWAHFQSGRLDAAQVAIAKALRTGTRDRVILYHAAEIARGAGKTAAARQLIGRALQGSDHFDLATAPKARALQRALAAS